MSRAILIGNGPSAVESKKGSLIDSDMFDTVIRFNRGHYSDDGSNTIEKFSDYVGTKTDYWIASDLRTHLAIQRVDKYKGIYIVTPKFKYNQTQASRISFEFPNIVFIPPDYEDSINQIVDFKPSWPSTGIVGIHFAINHFDEVYIHGFDTYNKKYDNLHFFDNRQNKYRNNTNVDHTPQKEKFYIEYMINNKNLKIL